MVNRFLLTARAERDLRKLDSQIEKRVRKKLAQFFSAEDPMIFATRLANLPPATHRFRVWKLRAKFFRKDSIFYITEIEFRDKVYRR